MLNSRPLLTIKFAFVSLISMTLLACANNNGGKAGSPTNPGTGPLGSNVGARNCEIGQIYNSKYGCLNQYDCDTGYGWVPAEFICVPGTVVTEEVKYGISYGSKFIGSLQVTNSSQFALMMKYAGLCDPYWVGWNWGDAKCSNWTNKGGFIEIRSFGGSNSSQASMYLGAGTSDPFLYNWTGGWMYGSGYAKYIGFSQSSKVVSYNNSAGIQIIGVDYSGRDVGIRAVVDNGRISNNSLTMKLYFQNVYFADAYVQRY